MSARSARGGWLSATGGLRKETKDLYAHRLQRLVAAHRGAGVSGSVGEAEDVHAAGRSPRTRPSFPGAGWFALSR